MLSPSQKRALLSSQELFEKLSDRELDDLVQAVHMKEVEARFSDAQIDFLDGITVTYDDWWANVRPSNTEPFLRMCLEADTLELMEEKRAALFEVLGEPVDH